MIKVADASGNPVNGMMRGDHGEIVVNDKESYLKYIRSRELENTVAEQGKQLNEMQSMLQMILDKLSKE